MPGFVLAMPSQARDPSARAQDPLHKLQTPVRHANPSGRQPPRAGNPLLPLAEMRACVPAAAHSCSRSLTLQQESSAGSTPNAHHQEL